MSSKNFNPCKGCLVRAGCTKACEEKEKAYNKIFDEFNLLSIAYGPKSSKKFRKKRKQLKRLIRKQESDIHRIIARGGKISFSRILW